jgi:tetratricopeptide (TPR) repeat protein
MITNCGGRSLRRFFLSIVFLLTILASSAHDKVYDFTEGCQQAYHEILKLKLASGQQLIDLEKQRNPDNLIPYLLENYIDFFLLFFNEDPAEYKKRSGNREKRLDILAGGPENSPYFLFSTATVHFQWAVIKIKFGYNWDAGWEFRRAFIQVRDNGKKFPAFQPNSMYRGAMQVAAGTIPDGYRWLSNLLGIRGTIQAGMKEMRNFLRSNDRAATLYRDEGVFYYCYLSYYVENDKEGVLSFIRSQKLDLVNNHLFAYLAANLSTHNQQAETALQILNNRNNDPAYMQSPVWDLEQGYILLYKSSPDALFYLERFVGSFKGKFYVKDALQKISWIYYLRGDLLKAEAARKQILTKGNTDSEADKLAQKEAAGNTWPDKILLQARLYNDGGYHHEALRLLHGRSASDYRSVSDQLEFNYRAGRIFDDLQRDQEAIKYYRITFSQGKNRQEYFAARAAIQMGFIFEKQKRFDEALEWFKNCLSLKDHDFKNGIDQRAKAGVNRCEVALKTP